MKTDKIYITEEQLIAILEYMKQNECDVIAFDNEEFYEQLSMFGACINEIDFVPRDASKAH